MKSIVFLLSLATLASGYSLERRGKICELCIDTLEEVKSATTSEQIEKLVTDVATTVCAFVPTDRNKCQQFVKKTMTQNFDLIREFTELWGPEEVCQMVYLCPKNGISVVEVEGTVCTLCADVVGVVRYISTDQALETMIEAYLETACVVTGPLSSLCKKSVKLIVDETFEEIRKIFNSMKDEEICQNLFLCKQSEVLMSLMTTSSLCDACTATVQEVEDFLAMDDLEKILEDISGVACSLLPVKALSESCTQMTQDALEEAFFFIQQLLNKYDGKTICQIAHLCKKEIPFVSGLEEASPGPLCLLCEDTLHLYRNLLTDPKLETAVNADIKFACSFTLFFHKTCENYADSFTGALFDQVRKTFDKFDDHNTCVLFDFCADSGNSTTVCDVCKDGFEEVKEFLTSDSLKTILTDEIDMACIAFGPFKRICRAEGHKLIDIVFSVFHKLDDISGEGLCSKLHLCKKPALF